jgi:hypothetical protein
MELGGRSREVGVAGDSLDVGNLPEIHHGSLSAVGQQCLGLLERRLVEGTSMLHSQPLNDLLWINGSA